MLIEKYGNIKNLSDPFLLNRGERCYEEDYVLEVLCKKNKASIQEINARVLSSSTYNEYTCTILINKKNSNLIEFQCECEQSKKRNKLCKHVIGAYLKYINELDYEESDCFKNIISKYKSPFKLNTLVDKITYKLQMCFTNVSTGSVQNYIEIKVSGEKDRFYSVKDIKDFLKAYYFNQQYEITKTFFVDFSKGIFCKEDTSILDFLLQILEVQESIATGYEMYNINKLVKDKRVFLIDAHLKRLLKLQGDKKFILNLPIGEYDNCYYKEDIDFKFSLEKQDNSIILFYSNNQLPYPLSSDLKCFFYKGYVYTISEDVAEIYIPLYKAMLESRGCKLKISDESKTDLISYVIPRLQHIGEIDISDELKDEFYREELSVNIYLDKESDQIRLRVIFIYGDVSINPLNEEIVSTKGSQNIENRGILIRAVEEELTILSLIDGYKFQQDKDDFVLKSEEDIVEFLVEGLNIFKEKFNVYYSDSFKTFKIHHSESFKCGLKVTGDNMLEFNYSLDGMSQNEFIEVFKSIKNKRPYYKLKNGEILLLQEQFITNVYEIINYLDLTDSQLTQEVIRLPKYDAFYIEQKLNDSNVYINKNKNFIELIYNIKESKEKEYEIPIEQKNILRPYQEVGFKWLKSLAEYGFGGILADEMGLGKTLQTITFLNSEKSKGTAIIVCPTSLVFNWEDEFLKFSPNLKIGMIKGDKGERISIIDDYAKYDILITSYPLLRRDIDLYKDVKFSYCVIDEAQQIKNPASQNAMSVKQIQASNRFALTGTPIENNLSELWSIFDFVMPSYLLSHNKFYAKYEVPISKDINIEANKELSLKISPFVLRRLKQHVIKELPPKIYNNIIVDMNEDQKRIYASYANCLKKEILEIMKNRGEPNKIKILSGLTRLRQICCDPSVFIDGYNKGSGKLEALYNIIESSREEGHRILVFSQFTSVLKHIKEHLKASEVSFLYLDGTIKAEDRMKMVNDFNTSSYDVFLISLKAGGTGLNLTAADLVIHFDPWWNPAVEEQATDRCHRIGQKNVVQVIKLIAKGTIEEKIVKLQEKKKILINNVMSNDELQQNLFKTMEIEQLVDIISL